MQFDQNPSNDLPHSLHANSSSHSDDAQKPVTPESPASSSKDQEPQAQIKEIGGRRNGLEPTRYGDWEFKGRCIDF